MGVDSKIAEVELNVKKIIM